MSSWVRIPAWGIFCMKFAYSLCACVACLLILWLTPIVQNPWRLSGLSKISLALSMCMYGCLSCISMLHSDGLATWFILPAQRTMERGTSPSMTLQVQAGFEEGWIDGWMNVPIQHLQPCQNKCRFKKIYLF